MDIRESSHRQGMFLHSWRRRHNKKNHLFAQGIMRTLYYALIHPPYGDCKEQRTWKSRNSPTKGSEEVF